VKNNTACKEKCVTVIKAESAAIVAEIRVAPGDEVSAGTTLLVSTFTVA